MDGTGYGELLALAELGNLKSHNVRACSPCPMSVGKMPNSNVDSMRFDTEADFYAAIRNSGLKPTTHPRVFLDTDNATWHVDDPRPLTPEQRFALFSFLEFKRNRGPKPP